MALPRFTLRILSGVSDRTYKIRELGDAGTYAHADYVATLQPKQREKIEGYLKRLAELGSGGFGKKNQFETFSGGVYELKPKPYRLLLGRAGTTWIIADAFSKDGTSKREQSRRIDNARTTLAEFVAEVKQRQSAKK